MVNAEFSRIYRFVKLLVNEGFLAVMHVASAIDMMWLRCQLARQVNVP